MNQVVKTNNSLPAAFQTEEFQRLIGQHGSGFAPSDGAVMPRISLRDAKFNRIVEGQISSTTDSLDGVLLSTIPATIARRWWETQYNQAEASGSYNAPSCFSMDGQTPDPRSKAVQASSCDACANSPKGAMNRCGFFKPVIFGVYRTDGQGKTVIDPHILHLNSRTAFNKSSYNDSAYNWKGYRDYLTAMNVPIQAVMTRLTFDQTDLRSCIIKFQALGAYDPNLVPQVQMILENTTLIEKALNIGNMETNNAQPPAQIAATQAQPQGAQIAQPITHAAEPAQPAPQGQAGAVSGNAAAAPSPSITPLGGDVQNATGASGEAVGAGQATGANSGEPTGSGQSTAQPVPQGAGAGQSPQQFIPASDNGVPAQQSNNGPSDVPANQTTPAQEMTGGIDPAILSQLDGMDG